MHISIQKDPDFVAETFETPITRTDAPTSGELSLSDESPTTKFIVRGEDGTAAARTLGVDFGRSRVHADEPSPVLVSGQRPAEWLLLGAAEAVGRLADGLDRSGHVSVIDVTHGQALLRLTGNKSANVLEKLCSLDLGDAMTPDGAAFSGSVAAVNCDLVRADESGPRSYRIMCDRSLGQYLFDTILDAGEEFGIVVGRGSSC